jgi:predicted PurR-regulated permease PerM
MNSKTKNWIFGSIALLIAVLFLWKFYDIVLYIIIAGFLSLLGTPIVRFFDKIGIGKVRFPRFLSAFIAMIIVIAMVFSFFAVFVPIGMYQMRIFSEIDIFAVLDNFKDPINTFEDFLIEKQLISGQEPLEMIISKQFLNMMNVTDFENLLLSLVNITGRLAIAIIAICLSTFFFLKDNRLLYRLIIKLTPSNLQEKMGNVLSSVKRLVVKYFWGIILDATIVILLITTGMYLLGVKNALMIGLIAGILNVIPYIGPLLSLAIGTFIGVTNELYHDPASVDLIFMIKIIGLYLIVNNLDGFILQPLIFGKIVKAHPLEIFFVVLIAAQIAGIFGMIIAIPAYSLLRIVAHQFLSGWGLIDRWTDDIET